MCRWLSAAPRSAWLLPASCRWRSWVSPAWLRSDGAVVMWTSILIAVVVLLTLALVFGALLGFASVRFKVEGNPLVDEIDSLLPQTQCGQCGFPGCRPYAEAIANGDAINKCPPGGESTIKALADLLDVEPQPLDAEHGVEHARRVAVIREDECIGCTKCIQACPVDADRKSTRLNSSHVRISYAVFCLKKKK